MENNNLQCVTTSTFTYNALFLEESQLHTVCYFSNISTYDSEQSRCCVQCVG